MFSTLVSPAVVANQGAKKDDQGTSKSHNAQEEANGCNRFLTKLQLESFRISPKNTPTATT